MFEGQHCISLFYLVFGCDRFHLLGLALRLSHSWLLMPPGFFCYAGGWHLCSKPCVVPFFFRLPSSCGILTSQLYLSPVCCSKVSMCVLRRRSRKISPRDIVMRFLCEGAKIFVADIALFRLTSMALTVGFTHGVLCPI